MYIILSKSNKGHLFDALGHEIHQTRFILFNLLSTNKIDNSVTLVTISQDRFFLYENIFKNIITYDNFVKNKKNDKIVLDLTDFYDFSVRSFHINSDLNSLIEYFYTSYIVSRFIDSNEKDINIIDDKKSNLPKGFDWKFYLNHHADLKECNFETEEQAINHYLEYGRNENRLYLEINSNIPKDFQWIQYLVINEDLIYSGIINEYKAKFHYFEFGQYENRIYKDNNFINILNKKIIDIKSNLNNSLVGFDKNKIFINYLRNINYCELDDFKEIIKDRFIIVHRRFNSEIEKINKIIKLLNTIYQCKIIIFSQNEYENLNTHSVSIIDNLQTYASLLNHKNCFLFISEWSGGGQLSQYCFDKDVLYYFDYYTQNNLNTDVYKKFEEYANQPNNIFNYYDFKNITGCKIKYFLSIDNLIEELKSLS